MGRFDWIPSKRTLELVQSVTNSVEGPSTSTGSPRSDWSSVSLRRPASGFAIVIMQGRHALPQ